MASSTGLYTIPQPIQDCVRYLPTGNEYVSLPTVRTDGGIESVNVLSMQARGLLEFTGDPLIAPRIRVEGHLLAASTASLPVGGILTPPIPGERDGVRGQVRLCAPPGRRGFVVLLQATNGATEPLEVTLEVIIHWVGFKRSIFSQRETSGHRHLAWDTWTRSLVMEVTTPVGGAALAVATTETLDEQTLAADSGRARLGKVYRLLPGEKQSLAFFFAVAQERDGARTTTMDLRRHGWHHLELESERWVSAHRPGGLPDGELADIAARNLMFNQFFATGRAVDTDELVLVTSRSPLYYVSAAFWARDALLWSFPGLLLTDPVLAREALVTAFARHGGPRNAGIHAHYINGVVLYPGFELDQLAAFLIALEGYVRATEDWAVLREPAVMRGLELFPTWLGPQRHPRVELYGTFLLSTDDPAPMPFVTYDNALTWKALKSLAELETGLGHQLNAAALAQRAANLRRAVLEHCVVNGPTGAQFAGAVDLEGRHILLDEPPGSLALLAHYGFCPADEPVYRNTLRWIDSTDNPHLGPAGRFQTAACIHAPYSWVLSLANMLLSGRGERAAEILHKAPLGDGLACESFDADTGRPVTGRHFATCAGFLGYALCSWLRNPS
jgi:uncharacterized protein